MRKYYIPKADKIYKNIEDKRIKEKIIQDNISCKIDFIIGIEISLFYFIEREQMLKDDRERNLINRKISYLEKQYSTFCI